MHEVLSSIPGVIFARQESREFKVIHPPVQSDLETSMGRVRAIQPQGGRGGGWDTRREAEIERRPLGLGPPT